jgi:hypothetical protein
VACVALGAAPVIVTVYEPGVVLVAIESVSVELPPAVTDVGLSEAVAPGGMPLGVNVTLSGVPLVTAVEMVEVPLPPWTMETLVGLELIEKSFAGGAIVSERVAACVALVPVPVTVTVYVPAAAVPALTVSVELPPAVTDVGLNDADDPAGWPLALSVTVCAAPLVIAVEIVEVPLPPDASERLVGLVEIEKSLGGGGAAHPGSWNVPMRVRQLNAPFVGMYSFAYQKVQPSTGSMLSEL